MQPDILKTSSARSLCLRDGDNVAVAIDAVAVGARAQGVSALCRISHGHKIATRFIARKQPVLKFGQVIGHALKDVPAGDWVHEHNVEVHSFARDYHFAQDARPEVLLTETERAKFQGLRRPNSDLAARRFKSTLGILPKLNLQAEVFIYANRRCFRGANCRNRGPSQ